MKLRSWLYMAHEGFQTLSIHMEVFYYATSQFIILFSFRQHYFYLKFWLDRLKKTFLTLYMFKELIAITWNIYRIWNTYRIEYNFKFSKYRVIVSFNYFPMSSTCLMTILYAKYHHYHISNDANRMKITISL